MKELYLVTGGAGFIGSHAVERLLASKRRVRVVDNFLTGRRSNVRGELLEGDIGDRAFIRGALKGVTRVIHLAALPSVPRSVERPLDSNRHNCDALMVLLEEARAAKAKRFVFASSSSVYGERPGFPRRERQSPLPVSPYAVTKYAAEHYVRLFSQTLGLEAVSLRFFNVYGPRQDPDSPYAAVIPKFIRALVRGEPMPVHGDGKQERDFTYVEDVVDGVLRAAHRPGVAGRTINVASGRTTTVLELAQKLAAIAGRPCRIEFLPPRAGDVRKSFADISLARRLLGFAPRFSLEEGLRRTYQWFCAEKA